MSRARALLLALLVLSAITAHLFAFGLLSARLALPAAVAGGVVLAAVAAHVGVLGPVGAWLHRRFHGEAGGGEDG